jgi:hypothetical protein
MFKIWIEASPMKGDPVPSSCVAATRMFDFSEVTPNDDGKRTLTSYTPLKVSSVLKKMGDMCVYSG